MKDNNGVEVTTGRKACIINQHKEDIIPNGSIGEVRDIKPCPYKGGKLQARVTAGPEDMPNWSAWCDSREFVLID
jgi:hypothetical protein